MNKEAIVFNGVRVFCTSTPKQRLLLDDQVAQWLKDMREQHPSFGVVDIVVRQSSDEAFHCLSIVFFFTTGSRAATQVRRGKLTQ